jgi:hypothetical protein
VLKRVELTVLLLSVFLQTAEMSILVIKMCYNSIHMRLINRKAYHMRFSARQGNYLTIQLQPLYPCEQLNNIQYLQAGRVKDG